LGFYLNTPAKAQAFFAEQHTPDYLVLDTEFVRGQHGQILPKLALIQLGLANKKAILIDPLTVKISDCGELGVWLSSPEIPVVIHSAQQDLEMLRQFCAFPLTHVWDTQIAAGLLGEQKPVSYEYLVSKYTKLPLDKSQRRSNWLERPLSKAQLEYAIKDVLYLGTIYQQQIHELSQHNRLDLTWLIQDEVKDKTYQRLKQHRHHTEDSSHPTNDVDSLLFYYCWTFIIALSKQIGVATFLLANQNDLKTFLLLPEQKRIEHPFNQSWRKHYLGNNLQRLLAGEVGLKVIQ
jgi:ribonuclease D